MAWGAQCAISVCSTLVTRCSGVVRIDAQKRAVTVAYQINEDLATVSDDIQQGSALQTHHL